MQRTTTVRSTTLLIILALLAITAGPPPARAQDGRPSRFTVEFGDDVLRLESIGFTMPMPVDAVRILDAIGTRARGRLFDPERTWEIVVESIITEEGATTRKAFADKVLETLLLRTGPIGSTKVTDSPTEVILREESLKLPYADADRYYARIPLGGDLSDPKNWEIQGRTLVQIAPDRFLVMTLRCSEQHFRVARNVYEVLVANSTLRDPSEVAATRGVLVSTGVKFFEQLSEDDIHAVVGDGIDQFERLYTPGPDGMVDGDTELGFRQTRIFRGSLADVPELSGVNQQGLVARIKARILLPDIDLIADSNAVFFLSEDGQSERWVVNTAVYTHDQNQTLRATQREVGARERNQMNVEIDGSQSRSIKPLIEGEGYLSLVHAYLLPRLLAHKGIPADYGFYQYRSKSNTICFRSEKLDRDPSAPGVWRITTRLSEDDGLEKQVTHIADDGRLLLTDLGDNRIWEPTEAQRILEIWRGKGLPSGRLGRSQLGRK